MRIKYTDSLVNCCFYSIKKQHHHHVIEGVQITKIKRGGGEKSVWNKEQPDHWAPLIL